MKTLYAMILKTSLYIQCLKQVGAQMLHCFLNRCVREVRNVLQLARGKVIVFNYLIFFFGAETRELFKIFIIKALCL